MYIGIYIFTLTHTTFWEIMDMENVSYICAANKLNDDRRMRREILYSSLNCKINR